MKLAEKIQYLQDNHMSEWLSERQEVDAMVSNQHSLMCVCGRLCTGLHESTCRKFIEKVNKETAKSLWKKLEL